MVAAKKILVVCPAVARYHWAREVQRWFDQDADIKVVTSKLSKHPALADIVIVSHDLLVSADTHTALLGESWDLLVIDEAHFLKSRGAKRTKAVYGSRCDLSGRALAAQAKRVWVLTGTPAPNHAGELWTHLRALYPSAIPGVNGTPMGENEFISQYCRTAATPWGLQVQGSKNMGALRTKMDGFFLRRLKKNVLTDLPAVTVGALPISLKRADGQGMNKVLSQYPDAAHLAEAAKTLTEDGLLDFLRANAAELATYRRHTGLLKLPVCLEWLKTEMGSTDKKFIVFAIHHAVIDGIVDHMAAFNPVKIDGRDSARDRDNAEQKFTHDPRCKLFVGQITAAGTAITLTVASDVVFFEADWTPSNNYQALSRAHRFTQTRGVVARFLTLHNSIDDTIQRALTRKTRELTQLFN